MDDATFAADSLSPEDLEFIANGGRPPANDEAPPNLADLELDDESRMVREALTVIPKGATFKKHPAERLIGQAIRHSESAIDEAIGAALCHEWDQRTGGRSLAVFRRSDPNYCATQPLTIKSICALAREHGWAGAQQAEPWPDPEPLPSGLPPVNPFDFALLPDALRPWIADIAERMQCPPDYPAVGAMVTLSAVVGRQVGIRPKRRDDWVVIPNLWGSVIGRPSLLKTPALQEPLRMIEAIESAAKADHEAAQRDFEAEAMIDKIQAKESEKALSAALKKKDKEGAYAIALEATAKSDPPERQRLLTHDATVEKLGELLKASPRGMLVFRDELVGFLRGLDKEGREGSRAFFLESWNGTGGFRFDRIGRGTIEIDAACVSILGGIQPGPLEDYLVSAIRGGAGDDGLVQRFQLAVWPDVTGDWKNIDRWPDTNARNAAKAVYEHLNALDAGAIGATTDDTRLPYLRFSEDAQEVFDTWRHELESRLRSDDLAPVLEAHLAKFRSLIPSLALLCHLADHPEGGPVDVRSLHRGCAWGEYLETHARRLYAPAIDPGMGAAVELEKRLSSLPDPFCARDVYRNGWRLLDRQGTTDALSILSDFGHIRGEESEGPGRPTTRYRVNPALKGARS
jgi:putative DNA primase/helicase